MPDTPSTVFRDFRGTKGLIEDADPSPPTRIAGKQEIRPGQSINTAQALASERKPEADEGTRAFGAPLGTQSERNKK